MKKIITYLLIVLNICSLTACKKSDVNSNISTLASSQSQTTSEVASQESSSVEIVSSNSSTTNKQSSKTEKTDTSQPQKTPQESSSDSNTSSYVSSTQSVTSYTEEELIEINKKRPDYDLGTCRKLEGTVSVLLFYMYDFESDWTREQMDEFTVNEVMPGLEFIEEQAKEYGINLKLQIERIYITPYFGKVITNANESITVTANVLEAAAKGINYNTPEEMIDDFERMIKTEVVCFTIFNKKGTSNAINPPRGSEYEFEEHCVIFSQDLESDGSEPVGHQASVIAHELLHLFGAEDLYTPYGRKKIARKYCATDVMLSAEYDLNANNIGPATAFYIGWTNKIQWYMKNYEW